MSDFSFTSSGLQRHKFGNAQVQYSADGRIIPGNYAYTAQPRVFHTGYGQQGGSPGHRQVYLDYTNNKRNDRRRNYYNTGFDRPVAGSDTRDYRPRQHRHRTGSADNSYRVSRGEQRLRDDERERSTWRKRQNYFGDPRQRKHRRRDMDIDDGVRPFGILFVVTGIIILAGALVNILFGVEHHYYCAWWVGFLVLEFGVAAGMHRGDYHSTWKNGSSMFMGLLSLLAAFVGTALIMDKLAVDFDHLIDRENNNALVEAANNTAWTVTLDGVTQAQRVWVTFGVDCMLLILFVFCYILLLPLMYLANRYYEENYRVTNKCEPWSIPKWFNPFGQLVLAEVVAFVGIVVRYGCKSYSDETAWYKYWIPVWSGALLFLAATVSVFAFKRPDIHSRVYMGMFLQLLAGVAMGSGVTININGLVDNVNVITDSSVTLSDSDNDLYMTSAVLYGLSAILMLPVVIYCMVVMGRLLIIGGKNRRDPYRDDRSFESASTTPTIRDRFIHRQHLYPQHYMHQSTPYPAYPNYFGHPQRY